MRIGNVSAWAWLRTMFRLCSHRGRRVDELALRNRTMRNQGRKPGHQVTMVTLRMSQDHRRPTPPLDLGVLMAHLAIPRHRRDRHDDPAVAAAACQPHWVQLMRTRLGEYQEGIHRPPRHSPHPCPTRHSGRRAEPGREIQRHHVRATVRHRQRRAHSSSHQPTGTLRCRRQCSAVLPQQ